MGAWRICTRLALQRARLARKARFVGPYNGDGGKRVIAGVSK
jgi:hypothetical protein